MSAPWTAVVTLAAAMLIAGLAASYRIGTALSAEHSGQTAGRTESATEAPRVDSPAANDVVKNAVEKVSAWRRAVRNWVVANYARAPTLMWGLAILLVFPVLAVAGALLQRRHVDSNATKLFRPRLRRPGNTGSDQDTARTIRPIWPARAWVELGDNTGRRFEIGRSIVRIGREPDMDIVLADPTVHRYHAAIHRTEDAEFIITDLSSSAGNGVMVNGRRVACTQLFNGDQIELGRVHLMFSARPT